MAVTTTQMELVSIDKLVPYVNNARTHNEQQIMKLRSSLREFGFINPVIIDRQLNVLAGHGRIMAAKAEGIKEVPCVYAEHLTEAQKKAYILADNRMALDADWDEELLKVEIEALQAENFDLGLTGFDEKELASFFDTEDEVEDDEFDADAELEKKAFAQEGDIWILGRHRLIAAEKLNRICCTMELDVKYASVIVRRYIEEVGSSDDVYVIRSDRKYAYSELGIDTDGV